MIFMALLYTCTRELEVRNSVYTGFIVQHAQYLLQIDDDASFVTQCIILNALMFYNRELKYCV